ncbi:MFS transporter [Actinocrispum wychmicini]|uniref:Putative MFS family arabinose efflux permease n=1 Tax=Actinocrispum wychmicini TaxID=1213861 RepID=A0A4R2IRJ3_9PSEU|nr:MFS transporter [Actinocrispum wychmicini]TCO48011.1 putative MFS family arabinose efflux permease [Actinocrispum wychmicini]
MGVPVRRLWLAVLCGYMALGATLQALPTYVIQRFHGGEAAAGTAVGIAFLATALVRPFAGRLADAGFAHPVVATGGVLAAIGGLGHLVAPNLGTLLVARLVMGAGEAALFSGAQPWVLAGTPPQRRGRVAGWFGLSMWGGLALGPVLAVGLNGWHGVDGVWWGVVAFAGVASVLVLTCRESGRETRRPNGFIAPAGAILPGVVLGLASYGYGTVSALMVLRLQHIGGENAALALFAAGFLLIRAFGSPLVDRYGGGRAASASLVVTSVGLAVIGWAPPIALVGGVIAGAGVALMYPATVAITLARVDASRPGAAVGAMTSFWDLGIMAAGPLGGVVAAGIGYPAAFTVAVAACLAGLVLTVRLLARDKRTQLVE